MTIVYFITTVGHGKGGHFHSLNTIANAIGKTQNVHVINIGYKPSEVLDSANYSYTFVSFNGYNVLTTYAKINKLIEQLQPDVIHAFDVESFAFSRRFSKKRNQPSFLNKCGGPNPKKYFPQPNQLILFSKENETYFKTNPRYNSTCVTVIPNRVKPVKVDTERVTKFLNKYGTAELSLLRIARIGKHYHKSIIQAINVLGWLRSKDIPVRLIIIGTIQSNTVYDEVKEYISSKALEEHVIIETSDEFTHNASELLDVGDIIIGTGRNFMEAASLNKMLLVPYKDSDYPLLVTDSNFDEIFATNFSPRTQVSGFNEEQNLNKIYQQLNRKQALTSKTWFNNYFNVKGGVKAYKSLYLNQDIPKKSRRLDTLVNVLYAIKTFIVG